MKLSNYELEIENITLKEEYSNRRASAFQSEYSYIISGGKSSDLFPEMEPNGYDNEEVYNDELYDFNNVFTAPQEPCAILSYAFNRQHGRGYGFKKLILVGGYEISASDEAEIIKRLDFAFK